jgi:hypothetical protein
MRLTLCTLGLFTIAAVIAPSSHSAAQGLSATTIDMSAQKKDEKPKAKKAQPKAQPTGQQKAQPRPQQRIQARPPQTMRQNVAPRNVPRRTTPQFVKPQQKGPKFVAPGGAGQKKILTPKTGTKAIVPSAIAPKGVGRKAARTFTPHGSRAVNAFKLRNAGRASFGGRNFSVWRQNHRVRYGGGWRTFVALGILAPLLIGANEFYPYAYLEAPEDYCEGLTEDGCELVWDNVETIEGDVIPQCVAYCPWQ